MTKSEHIAERAQLVGRHIAETRQTIRQTAQVFGVTKSTIHKDVRDRLPHINRSLALQAFKVLEENYAVRHLRGGEARRIKCLKLKNKKELKVNG